MNFAHFAEVLFTANKPSQSTGISRSGINALLGLAQSDREHCRTAAALNGEIVSDSESDNAEGYIGILSIADECAKRIIARKRKSLARRVRRQKAKTLAARKFLSRKVSRRVNTIVDQFPDIGEKIESFVSESNIGADAWRRTGVLTFDGNLRVNKKVTYERIRQHLIDTYHHNFSYGTIIQLCVARNRRRRPRRIIEGWPRLQREEPAKDLHCILTQISTGAAVCIVV